MRLSASWCSFIWAAAGAAFLFPGASGAAAQSAPATITLPVTTVDNHGNPVKNLTAADLTLTDNGQAQTIGSFAPDPSSHLLIGIVGQTSTGLRQELGDMRLASVQFIDHTLPGTDDKAFVIQYSNEVDLLADPTSTPNKLHDAINQLGSPQFGGAHDDSGGGTAQAVGGTMNDAIYLAAMEEMKKQPGRHILVLISDGIDHGSKESTNEAVEAAQRTHTAIFAIYYQSQEEQRPKTNPNPGNRGGSGYPGGGPGGYPGGGPGGYPGGPGRFPGGGYPGGGGGGGQAPAQRPHEDGKLALEHICSATGGYMIEGRRDKASEAYAKLGALLKNQYTLSYTPGKEAAASDFHRISLTVKKKNVWALVQEGYMPGAE